MTEWKQNPQGEELMPRYWIWYQEKLNSRIDRFLKKVNRHRTKPTKVTAAAIIADALKLAKWDEKELHTLRRHRRGQL